MQDGFWLVSYWFILIPLVFYSLLLFVGIVKPGRRFSLYNGLLAVYVLSLLANVLTGFYYGHRFRIDGLVYFTAVTYLFIHPFKRIDVVAFGDLSEINMKPFYLLSIFFIAISLVSIQNSIAEMSNAVFALGADDVSKYRLAMMTQMSSASEKGIIGILADWSHGAYFIVVTLFFIGVIKKANKIVLILLFICSLSVVSYYLMQSGRTGAIYYLVCWLFNYFIFYRFLPPKSLAFFRRYAFVLLALLITPVVIISVSRFGGGYLEVSGASNPLLISLLDYLGQGIVNFDVFYQSGFDRYSYGVQLFPLFYRILYTVGLTSYDYNVMYEEYRVLYPNSWFLFATFLRELWYNFGLLGTILVGLLFNFLMKKVDVSLRSRVTARSVLWLYVSFSMVLFGIFSLNLAGMTMNFALLLLLMVRIEYKRHRKLPNKSSHSLGLVKGQAHAARMRSAGHRPIERTA